MTFSRRLRRRLLALLVVAGVSLGAAAGDALAAVPVNDTPNGALAVSPATAMPWTTLTPPLPFSFSVASDVWPQATTSPTEDLARPSCTGSLGEHSLWFQVSVSEPSILRAWVESANLAGFQPVVTILSSNPQTDPTAQEVGCGSASSAPGSLAVAEGYVPTGTAYIRVAQVGGSGPPPDYVLFLAGRDVTPPTISVKMPAAPAEPGVAQRYDAEGTTDGETLVDPQSATWTFHDGPSTVTRSGVLATTYIWRHTGAHRVSFRVADTADNFNVYTFPVFVVDRTPPRMHLALAVPFPGDRHLRVALTHSEPVVVRLVVFQGGRRLFTTPRRLTLAGKGRTTRLIALSGRVAATPRLVVTGTATDGAGNATALPTCELDPVRGTGRCFSP